MRAHDNEDAVARPIGTIDEGEASSWGPQAPDGGPTPEAANLLGPVPVPAFSALNVPCLRDCRHFLRVWSHFDTGNTAGCFDEGKEPRVQHLSCMVQPGVHLELTADSPVLECNRWDPIPDHEFDDLEDDDGPETDSD
jgi:hypothetical protein